MVALDDNDLNYHVFKCSSCKQENLLAHSDLEFLKECNELFEENYVCERCGFDMVISNEIH